MVIEGIIEEIIFRNDENGYTVAVIEHNFEYTTIVGKFLKINVGENVKLTGEFITNNKYGEQFSFSSYESVYPSSKEGIKKYLSSGLIKGIGEVTAKAIVDMFGETTFEVIEFSPEKLTRVKGISEKKAEAIAETFGELKKLQNSVIFLQSYNITTNMSLKIYEKYQDRTVEIVKQNPYKLVEDIDGIGFSTADKIAMVMGVSRDSSFRIRAGMLHVMNESAEKNGNTFLPKGMLFENVSTLLELDKDMYNDGFEDVLNNLCIDKVLTNFFKKPYDVVMLTKLYFTESGVSQKLALLNTLAKESDKDVESDITTFETVNKISFDKDQKNAIKNAISSGVSVITGGPGTGKTTIIKCIINILEQQGNKVLLMAPTGRAAKRMSESTNREAKTIHRALEINFNSKDNGYFVFNDTNPLDVDAVIVDEVSMVDVNLMHNLLKALPKNCKLILVGDKDQLPSVGAGNVLDDILKSEIISTGFLTKIFRQENNSLIIFNAHKINNGEMPTLDNSSSDFFFEAKEESIDIKNSVVEMVTKRIPNFLKIESSKIQVLAPLKAGPAGVENINKELQEKLNPSSVYKVELILGNNIFREGDKVMQTSNNYDIEWKKTDGLITENGAGVFNGDIGYIHKINRQTGETIIWFEDGRECCYPKNELTELALAYAITIHKSQGSEFDVVIIPIISGPMMILTRNLIYTAVTRAKKMVVLVGDKKNLRRMVSNSYTVQRFTMLKQFLIESDNKVKELFME